MAKYNGHRSWNAWSVSLWINNDESLYRLALECVRDHRTRREAAQGMLDQLERWNINKTPDGAPYTVTSIREAMREM